MTNEQMMGTDMTKDQWNRKVEEYLEEDNKHVGKVSIPPLKAGISTSWVLRHRFVTEDLIRDYARAMGNPDPLYNDPAYGRSTSWGGMVAPPTFTNCLAEAATYPVIKVIPPPGWGRYYGGTEFKTFQPIRPGDEFHVTDKYLGHTEKTNPGKPYRLFYHAGQRTYINQKDEIVCIATGHEIITATYPGEMEDMTKTISEGRKRRPYTKEELDKLHQHYDDELAGKHRRGAEIRYWDDVVVGEELEPVIKGPLNLCDLVQWYGGCWGATFGAFAVAWEMTKTRLHDTPIDPETGEYIPGISWHYLDWVAQTRGVPKPIAFGAQNEGNIAHIICNWMGDDAFVKHLSIQHRRPNYHGDMNFLNGKVMKKYVEDGEHLVDLEVWSETQDAIKHMVASATIRLISKE